MSSAGKTERRISRNTVSEGVPRLTEGKRGLGQTILVCPEVFQLSIYKLAAVRPEFTGLFDDLAAFVVNLLHAFHDIARGVRQIAGMIRDLIRNSTRLIPRAPFPAR